MMLIREKSCVNKKSALQLTFGERFLLYEIQEKSSPFAEDATVNSLLPQARRKLRMLYMQRLNWNNRIKQDIIHRQVMQTIRRYRNEDDMDFDEALKAAIDRRKYLFN